MDAPQARKEMLVAQFETADEPPPLLHLSMADLYRSKVEVLRNVRSKATRDVDTVRAILPLNI